MAIAVGGAEVGGVGERRVAVDDVGTGDLGHDLAHSSFDLVHGWGRLRTMPADLTGATVELLQTLIRNQCVNDGTPASGEETRNADVLQSYVEGPGVTIERWEPTPGRASFVGPHRGHAIRTRRACA